MRVQTGFRYDELTPFKLHEIRLRFLRWYLALRVVRVGQLTPYVRGKHLKVIKFKVKISFWGLMDLEVTYMTLNLAGKTLLMSNLDQFG